MHLTWREGERERERGRERGRERERDGGRARASERAREGEREGERGERGRKGGEGGREGRREGGKEGGREGERGRYLAVVELHDLPAGPCVPQPHRVVVPTRRPHLRPATSTVTDAGTKAGGRIRIQWRRCAPVQREFALGSAIGSRQR